VGPAGADGIGISFAGVAFVATSGGDYSDPYSAISDYSTWCGSPTEVNRCLLKIYPGVYDIGENFLGVYPNMVLEGSGRDSTTIIGQIDGEFSGVIAVSDNSEVRDLTVINEGGGDISTAVIFKNASNGQLTRVVARGLGGGTTNIGVHIRGSSPKIIDVVAEAGSLIAGEGGVESNALRIVGGGTINYTAPSLRNVEALARGGSDQNTGIRIYNSYPELFDVSAIGFGGDYAAGLEHTVGGTLVMHGGKLDGFADILGSGIIVRDQSTVILEGVAVTASSTALIASGVLARAFIRRSSINASNTNAGIAAFLEFGSLLNVEHSTLVGLTNALVNNNSVANIALSKIFSPGVRNEQSGVTTCAGVYDQDYAFYADTCP